MTDTRDFGFDIQAELKGTNVPGSKVLVTLRKSSGNSGDRQMR